MIHIVILLKTLYTLSNPLLRLIEMSAVVPFKDMTGHVFIGAYKLILSASAVLDSRHNTIARLFLTVAETEINGAVLRSGMALGVAYPVPEPHRARTADNSAERLTFIERPQAEKSCEGVSAEDTLSRETVLLFAVWNALVHKPVQR